MMRSSIILCIVFIISACVGTDSVNDEIVNLSISIEESPVSNNAAAAIVGSEHAFSVSATNDRGTTYEPSVTWNSSNTTVATIDEDGNLQAVAAGSTLVTATAQSVQSTPVKITVVEDNDQPALIEISGTSSSIAVGEQIDLSARALNADGGEVKNVSINWESDSQSIASVNSTGTVTGQSSGSATIIARSDNLSGSYSISVGQASERSGSFEGVNGYTVEGTAVLEQLENESLTLQLQDDFNSSSGPGLFLYLTNNGTSIAGGVEIGELKSFSGAESYTVPEGVTIDQYNQVLIYCKPFGVPFGIAELETDS